MKKLDYNSTDDEFGLIQESVNGIIDEIMELRIESTAETKERVEALEAVGKALETYKLAENDFLQSLQERVEKLERDYTNCIHISWLEDMNAALADHHNRLSTLESQSSDNEREKTIRQAREMITHWSYAHGREVVLQALDLLTEDQK